MSDIKIGDTVSYTVTGVVADISNNTVFVVTDTGTFWCNITHLKKES